jgi:pyruvate/2-oxoglutarate dehydrogenase complex dihydrolipoamide dehydrogenase (E3) component
MATEPLLEPDDEFNRTLQNNARPAAYTPPTPAAKYNLVVIGAGPAGLVVAAGAAALGAKVALVERHLMGGDCLNVGCVPSKALLRSARAVADVRGANEFGVRGPGARADVDFGAVMQRLRRLRAEISRADSVERFRKLGVDVFIGEGRFCGADAVEVGGARLRFARAAITIGSAPAIPDIPGLKEAGFETNTTIFNLTTRPERLCIIGGGPIGCEMAQAFQRLGTRVTLLQRGPRLLPRDDEQAARIIQSRLEGEGVRVICGAKIQSVSRVNGGECVVSVASETKVDIGCDRILASAGRKVDVASLGLDAAGIRADEHGISVDDFLRTTNSKVYAAGDCCSKFKFTHAADAMARILIRNALFFGRQRVSKLVIPWTTYTEPEVAQLGLTVAAAAKQGIACDVLTVELRDVDRAVLDGSTDGFGRLLLKKGSDEIIGATLVAAHAGDMIPQAVLAMQNNLGAGRFAEAIFPYPTQAEIWRKLGDAYNRSRLTPFNKKVLSGIINWRRGGD